MADEDAAAAFALAGRAVEIGLRPAARLPRAVAASCATCCSCRSIPSRAADPEIAREGERERLTALAARFSREDLLRAFDLLSTAEQEIRDAAQPRYHLEMALLRWMHLRKLVPIEDLIANLDRGGAAQLAPAAGWWGGQRRGTAPGCSADAASFRQQAGSDAQTGGPQATIARLQDARAGGGGGVGSGGGGGGVGDGAVAPVRPMASAPAVAVAQPVDSTAALTELAPDFRDRSWGS